MEKKHLLIMFNMEYNNFIQSSLLKIIASRQDLLNTKIISEHTDIPNQPSNIYIQLVVEKNGKMRKIQQWNFISLQNLVASQYGNSVDSQLDSIEVEKKPYMQILQEKLQQFSPKFLIKILQPNQIYVKIKTNQTKLTPFIEQSNYIIEIYDYQGPDYSSRISLKTVHNQLPRSVRASDLISSDSEFEELIDQEFQKQIREYKEKMGQSKPKKEQLGEQQENTLEKIGKQKDNEEQEILAKNTILETKQISMSIKDPNIQLLHQIQHQINSAHFQGWTLDQFLASLQ